MVRRPLAMGTPNGWAITHPGIRAHQGADLPGREKVPTTTNGVAMTDDEEIRLTEGTHAPPEIDFNPVESDDDPDTVTDPDTGDMPDDLPAGSYNADRTDTDGADDLPPASDWGVSA